MKISSWGTLGKIFFQFSNLDCHGGQLKCKWRVIECCLKAKKSSNEPPTFGSAIALGKINCPKRHHIYNF